MQRATEPGGALIVMAFDRAGTRALAAVPAGVPMVAAVETPSAARPRGSRGSGWMTGRPRTHATQYLLGLGHRTVHYVAHPGLHRHQPPAGRAGGSALQEAGVPVPEPPCRRDGQPRSGYQAGRELAADPAVTAVLCGNDDLALGVHPGHARGRAAGPGQRQRGRLRRHPAVGVLDARA